MNGSRLIAGCFRFIFGSRYAESTRSKFGVSAYSRINTVYPDQNRQSVYPFSDQKTLRNEVAHTYIGYIREYPPDDAFDWRKLGFWILLFLNNSFSLTLEQFYSFVVCL